MTFFVVDLAFAANYYVNDNVITGDIYCTSTGNNAANGLSSNTPKASLSNVWSTYGPSGTNVLTSSDTIFIDAGVYIQTDQNLYIDIALVIKGAGMEKTIFDNEQVGVTGYYFMRIAASVHLYDFQVYRYGIQNTYAHTIQVESGVTGVQINYIHINKNGRDSGLYPVEIQSGAEVLFRGGGMTCNTWFHSGGINIVGSTTVVDFIDYVFYGNSRGHLDGSIVRIEDGTVSMRNVIFEKNACLNGSVGNILQLGGEFNIYDSKFTDNEYLYSFNEYGGTILVNAGDFYMTRSIIQNTKSIGGSYAYGAAICFDGTTGLNTINATIDSCYFSNNTGSRGNDIHSKRSNTTVDCYKTIFASASDQVGTTSSGTINLTNCGNPSVYTNTGITNKINTISSDYTANPTVADYEGECADGVVILPVELMYFDFECNQENAQLHWITASEYNNEKFLIEVSDNGEEFQIIGEVFGSGTTSLETDYRYELHPNERHEFYRLTQIDFDGNQVSFNALAGLCGELLQANFDSKNKNIRLMGLEKNMHFVIQIINTMGQQMYWQVYETENEVVINVESWPRGVYIISVITENKQETIRIFIS